LLVLIWVLFLRGLLRLLWFERSSIFSFALLVGLGGRCSGFPFFSCEDMSFWGLIVKGGAKQKVEVPEEANLVVTQAAIDSTDKDPSVLYVESEGNPKLALATLANGRTEQARFDLIFESGAELTFSVKGKADVHLVGYYTSTGGMDDSDLDDEYDFGSEDEDEEEDLEGEAPLPNTTTLGKRQITAPPPQANKKGKGENGAPLKPQQPQQAPQKQNPNQNQQSKPTQKEVPKKGNQQPQQQKKHENPKKQNQKKP